MGAEIDVRGVDVRGVRVCLNGIEVSVMCDVSVR